ncbi:hypothetical protein AB0323_00390 [Arthrobacter sp. NPDC080031]|uniref:hypothetical protein n=1 Tax=Arthrobacter sp. NPDC080031 TaxID=3155918 RepID=UPI00344D1AB1
MNRFDTTDSISALLSTFAVVAVGFVARPIGGLLIGWLGDRTRHKFTLVVTMLLLAGTSAAIAVTPTYSTIEVWASGLLLWRLLQGLAQGGETGRRLHLRRRTSLLLTDAASGQAPSSLV